MKQIRSHALLKAIIADITIYAIFCALLFALGAYTFGYMEHMTTFYYQGHKIVTTIEQPGGLCQVIAAYLIQFFVYPTAGVFITAALLTVITILMARLVRFMSDTLAYTPMAFAPAIALAILCYNVNYMYSGLVAMALMLLMVNVMFRKNYKLLFSTRSYRVIYTVVATFFLYTTCGADALLFGILVIIATLFKRPKETVYYLICPVLTIVQAMISVRSGLICDMEHAILPYCYYTHRLDAPSIIMLPWVLTIGVVLIGCILGKLNFGLKVKRTCFVVMCVLSLGFAALGGSMFANSQNEKFKKLNCLMRAHDWQGVITECPPSQTPNLLLLNCVNLALAEQGELADSLFSEKCVDIRNIYISSESNPYMNMLLSDIYWSMGHIALSQRYAFEANESLDNSSPRMLQRLIDTNIVQGNYKTARKLLRALERTKYYKDWAEKRIAQLNDAAVEADPELSIKRACIFADNRFSGIKGLDDDLWQVLSNNPDHRVTGQYLGSLYLLSKDLDSFVRTVDEFYSDTSLPKTYQEGIIAAFGAQNDSIIEHYKIAPATLQRYQQYKSSPHNHRNNLWYFLHFVQ